MKSKHILNILLASFFFSSVTSGIGWKKRVKTDVNNDYYLWFEQISHLKVDETQTAEIENLTIQRDVAEFQLRNGKLILLKPINGKTVGLCFIGDGVFTAKPPVDVERGQLYRSCGDSTANWEFSFLLILFNDTSYSEIVDQVDFHSRKPPREIKNRLRYALKYITDSKHQYVRSSLVQSYLSEQENGYFWAHFSDKNSNPKFFEIDPYSFEKVKILKRADIANIWMIPEIICQFHGVDEYSSGRDDLDNYSYLVDIVSYKIDCLLPRRGDFQAKTQVRFLLSDTTQKWIPFNIYHKMEMDSIKWSDGSKAIWFKGKENGTVWLELPEHQVELDVAFHYHGDLIGRHEYYEFFYIKTEADWYPWYGVKDRALFEMTYKFDNRWQLVSVGRKVSEEPYDKKYTNAKWIVDEPIKNISFNFGIFEEKKFEFENLPSITVLMSESGHQKFNSQFPNAGIPAGKDMKYQVGADIINSMNFFTNVYGPLGKEHYYISETPRFHGVAFPGMIKMSWTTFQNTDRWGSDHVFRAHEAAHQWWGINVDFNTYHDQWLSEGLATYSSLWYLQYLQDGYTKYSYFLNEWKELIIKNRKYLLGEGQKTGPIWLGYRNSSSTTEGDFSLIVYRKSAWVFHMLRTMMLDWETLSDERFVMMMSDFYKTYNGKRVSTNDFQKFVESYTQYKMDWFFNQWVYGTEIPTYTFSYKTEITDDGKCLVHCRVKQEGVKDDFIALVPLSLNFGSDKYYRIQVLVKGSETEFDLPLQPMVPKEIEFNYLDAVLCTVNYD